MVVIGTVCSVVLALTFQTPDRTATAPPPRPRGHFQAEHFIALATQDPLDSFPKNLGW